MVVIPDQGWEEFIGKYNQELQAQVKDCIDTARDLEIQKLLRLTIQASKDTMEELINYPIYKLNDNFWEEINSPIKNELALIVQNCRLILDQGFKARGEEIKEFVDGFLREMRKFTTDYVKKLFRDINTNLTRRFKEEFMNDERGTQRNWIAIEEQKIRELSNKAQESVLYATLNFKFIEIDYHDIDKLSGTAGGDPSPGAETPGGDPQSFADVADANDKDEGAGMASPSILYDKLLSEQEINKVKDRFKDDVEEALDEAVKKHHNMSSGGTPTWLYVLILYFAYDDVWRMVWNPIIFTPLILIVSVFGLIFASGLGPVVFPQIKQEVNKYLRLTVGS